MLIIAFTLVATGILVALLGEKLFRVLLPIVGLVSGTAVGFVGFQGVFGTGAVSTTIAVFVAMIVGLLLAVLSFLFFNLAVSVYAGLLGATVFSYGGISLGIGGNGFVMFTLTVAGFIIGYLAATSYGFKDRLVIAVTSMAGVALILAGVFLIAGDLTIDQLNDQGIIGSVVRVVDQSFLWVFVLLGGSLVAMQFQHKLRTMDVLHNAYQFSAKSK